jgi:hypothetical protein
MAESPRETDLHRGVKTPAAACARGFVAAAVFASFLGYSLIQAPIPAPNEPHYLTKAKHYWNPDFCPGDFFLDSSNAHLVFYQTVGLLTLWLPLPQTAFVGRLIAYALLAVGWTSCLSRLLPSRAATPDGCVAAHPSGAGPLWAAWVYLAIVTVGNLSGEWMVGGVEAKVFAYAFVFLAMAGIFDHRWRSAGVFAGLAVSFHPVVGMWAVVAGGMATAFAWLARRRSAVADAASVGADAGSVRHVAGERKRVQIGLLLGVFCALPGLVPAVRLVTQERFKATPSANMIQVFERLGHHLDPRRFRSLDFGEYEIEAAWLAYTLLGLFVLGLYSRMERSREQKWFGWFVAAAAVIAVGGLIVGLVPRLPDGRPDASSPYFDLRVSLMKFYPFRLADVFLPVAAAMSLVAILEQRAVACPFFVVKRAIHAPGDRNEANRWTFAWIKIHATSLLQRLGSPAIFVGFLAFAYLRPIADRNPSHMKSDEFADWVAVCRWCDEELPADAVVLTPLSSNWGFKWYAQRAEYVSYKDCPQDTAGILEWRRRLRYINRWGNADENFNIGYTRAALQKLATEEGITHIVAYTEKGPFAAETIYPRDPRKSSRFRVYRLPTGR